MSEVPELDRTFLPLDYPIGDLSFRVYCTILRLANGKGDYFGTLDDIGYHCVRKSGKGMNKSSVFNAIGELKSYDLLTGTPGNLRIGSQIPYTHEDSKYIHILRDGRELRRSVVGSTTKIVNKRKKRLLVVDLMRRENGAHQLESAGANGCDALLSQQQNIGNDLPPHTPPSNDSNSYINNTYIKNSTGDLSDKLQEDDLDEFTRKHFPGSPCTVLYAEMYFEGFLERKSMDGYDPRKIALAFFEHWHNKKKWLHQRSGKTKDKFPTRITFDRVGGHLTTWAKNISKGWEDYRLDQPDTPSETPSEHPWLNYHQLLRHAQINGLTSGPDWMKKYYETKGDAPSIFYRYRGPYDLKYKFNGK